MRNRGHTEKPSNLLRLGEEERRRAVRGLEEEVEAEARAPNKPVLGTRAVRAQHPHTRPVKIDMLPTLPDAPVHGALRKPSAPDCLRGISWGM
ncbi:hypothetical protein MEBOL_002713 [Melittangium boletus DSM 14713]|uniref:Uncharacterized protein n=1 Tax=Melittangium boletus DSM 14713 TaxID=1294270 RepID=A0A250IBN3_9BACT|nr:hypothetical protein MEBOL_002713 [Melittangium boletus DSM 14713]